MGAAHVGDESAGGFHGFHQCLDVAGMGGTHLYDGNLVLGLQAQQRLRNAHVVVEVALGVEHIIFLRQHFRDKFLGSRLAVGASDADDGNLELPAMLAGQVLKRLQAVVDFNNPTIIFFTLPS